MSDSDSDSDSDIDLPQPLPAIHAAVRNLDVDALRRALAAGASIEETDVAGWTPLYRACKNRVYGVITRTVPKYWNKRISDRVAMVRALLEYGASVHARCDDDDDTPLLAAVMNRNFPSNDIVEMLIAAGADIEAADNADFCVLYTAAQHGRSDAVTALIAAGADVHRICHDFTALQGATLMRNVRTYAPLLRAGVATVALPEPDQRNAYLNKIAATPGGFPAYEREHRRRLTAVFTNKFPTLPVEVISHIVHLWGHCGDYLY
jgi:hypothetical protein